ncbi:MAG: CPBP family intramembrane metalloprotease [Saprospiraceae bacterium]|nr:CPBP family intramembrane metalloprotease [Saprospiraceae bacterium]
MSNQPVNQSSNQAINPSADHPVWVVLAGMFMASILLTIIGGGLFQLLAMTLGWDTAVMSGILAPDAPPAERWQMRLMLAIGHVCSFVLAGWVVVRFFYPPGQRALAYLRANHLPDLRLVFAGIFLLLASIPLVLFLYNINQALPLPDSFRLLEEQTTDTIKGLLQMDNGLELLANLTLIALLPAIGEELVFRGVVQQQLQRRIASPWLAIVLASAIFSFIHFQFEGFLPRMLLGILLGWLYWRSQNLWVPAAAHFVNNATQVVGQFLYSREISTLDLEQDIEMPWPAAVGSLLLVLGIMYLINRRIHHSPFIIHHSEK